MPLPTTTDQGVRLHLAQHARSIDESLTSVEHTPLKTCWTRSNEEMIQDGHDQFMNYPSVSLHISMLVLRLDCVFRDIANAWTVSLKFRKLNGLHTRP